MGSFTISYTGELNQLYQEVYLDGVYRPDIACLELNYSHAEVGISARFSVPRLTWDESKTEFDGAEVIVYTTEAVSQNLGDPVFIGLIDSDTSVIDNDSFSFTARSLAGWMTKVYIGQELETPEVHYPDYAVNPSGVLVKTDWTVKSVLQDWFTSGSTNWDGGGGKIPSQWRAKLKLGSLTELDDDGIEIGHLVFRLETLADALGKMLEFIGNVSFYERFSSSGITYLEFYYVGDPDAAVKKIICGQEGVDVISNGANVLSLTHNTTHEDPITRLKCFGAPKRVMVSIATDSTEPLDKWWNSDLNAAVLADPELSTKGSSLGQSDISPQSWTHEHTYVYRRYRLPRFLRTLISQGRITVMKSNILQNSEGRAIPIQVWKIPRLYALGDGNPYDITSTLSVTPERIDNVDLNLDEGWFMLREPAVNVLNTQQNSKGLEVDTFVEATVGITLTIEIRDWMNHDTGQPINPIFGGVGNEGLIEEIKNESFKHEAILTGGDFEITDDEGNTYSYSSCWFELDEAISPFVKGMNNVVSQDVLSDDRTRLRTFVDRLLLQRNKKRKNYSITIPHFTKGYRVGNRIRVYNQSNYDFGIYHIDSISVNLEDPQTTITVDNSKPVAKEVGVV